MRVLPNSYTFGHINPDTDCLASMMLSHYNETVVNSTKHKIVIDLNNIPHHIKTSFEIAISEIGIDKFITKEDYLRVRSEFDFIIIVDVNASDRIYGYEHIISDEITVYDHHSVSQSTISSCNSYYNAELASCTMVIAHYLENLATSRVSKLVARWLAKGFVTDTEGLIENVSQTQLDILDELKSEYPALEHEIKVATREFAPSEEMLAQMEILKQSNLKRVVLNGTPGFVIDIRGLNDEVTYNLAYHLLIKEMASFIDSPNPPFGMTLRSAHNVPNSLAISIRTNYRGIKSAMSILAELPIKTGGGHIHSVGGVIDNPYRLLKMLNLI